MTRSHVHGQHFLRSPRLVAELIGHSKLKPRDVVYDLGAGSGVITAVLAHRVARVVAVEIEPGALQKLRVNVGDLPNVTILEQDIGTLMPPREPYTIFANIPFNLSSVVVRHFGENERPPRLIYLIAQKQFARKLVPGADHFTSQLGAQIGARYTVKIRKPLRRTDFTPPPGVDTVLLELVLRETPLVPERDLATYREFVARCFAEQKFYTQQPRDKAGLSPELRPSQLTLEQWVTLFAVRRAR